LWWGETTSDGLFHSTVRELARTVEAEDCCMPVSYFTPCLSSQL
jgi:hypothetical protein